MGDPGGGAGGEDEDEGDVVPTEGDALCPAVDVLCATVGDAIAKLGLELVLASLGVGPSASLPVDEAANTTAPSAMSAASAAIGTRAMRRPRGNGSRQLGQNPDTGVVTYPQFRHWTGRRFRAMAWLAAFSVRDRF